MTPVDQALGATTNKATTVPTLDNATEETRRAIATNIGRVTHEANRAYCLTLGDTSHLPWDQSRADLRESVISGVLNIMTGVVTRPGQSHQRWIDYKIADGWRYGPTKDIEAKTHPNLIPFEQLPQAEQLKDFMFVGIVRALLGMDLTTGNYEAVQKNPLR